MVDAVEQGKAGDLANRCENKQSLVIVKGGDIVKINDKKLRVALYSLNVTQTELAKRTGLSLATIGNVCNGKSCSQETAEKIAAAIGVPLEKLTKGKR